VASLKRNKVTFRKVHESFVQRLVKVYYYTKAEIETVMTIVRSTISGLIMEMGSII